MAASDFVGEAEAQAASARPLAVRPPPDFFRDRSPYFAEHVRRDIGKRYGEKALWEGGLQVETTLVPWVDEAARENVDFSLRKLDKRQGRSQLRNFTRSVRHRLFILSAVPRATA